jgi:hypothetical protein
MGEVTTECEFEGASAGAVAEVADTVILVSKTLRCHDNRSVSARSLSGEGFRQEDSHLLTTAPAAWRGDPGKAPAAISIKGSPRPTARPVRTPQRQPDAR